MNPAKVHAVHDRCVLRIDTEHSAAAPQTEQDARHAATWLLKLSQLSLCSGDDSSAGRSDRCRSPRPLPIEADPSCCVGDIENALALLERAERLVEPEAHLHLMVGLLTHRARIHTRQARALRHSTFSREQEAT